MPVLEIISIVATFIGVTAFSVVFTILYNSYVRSTVAQVQSGKRDIELIDSALCEKSKKSKRIKKIFSAIKTAIFALFMATVIPIFLFSLITRIARDKPIFGKTFMAVASGSMGEKNRANDYLISNNLNDQFKKYDIIFLDRVSSPDDLKLYDIIAYRNGDGVNIIHRITAITADDAVKFTTRGDANNANDDYTPTFSDVIGVYRGVRIGTAGIVIMFLQSYSGIITVAALLYCLIMIDRVSQKIEKCQNERLAQLLSAIQSDDLTAKAMRAEFNETIYYQGFAYMFNENGFVEKFKIPEGSAEWDAMLKIYNDGTPPKKVII